MDDGGAGAAAPNLERRARNSGSAGPPSAGRRGAAGARPSRARRKTASNVEAIGLEELCLLLADPDTEETSLIPYLVADRPASGMAPVLKPNPNTVRISGDPLRARADLGLGFLNGVYRKRRENLFRRRLARGDTRPLLLAEGDSWFQYPVWLKDVIDCLQDDFTVCCLSAAGDTLDNMASRKPEYLKWLKMLTEKEGRKLHAVLLSAGGNDLVGDQLAGMVNRFEAGRNAAWYVDNPAYRARENRVVEGYRSILREVRAGWPDLQVLIHGYDHAIPRPPQGFQIPPRDGWLGDPLRKQGIVDPPLQQAIVKVMIDRLNERLEEISRQVPEVSYVDLRSVVAGDWHDELHPNDDGFARVAARIKDRIA
jgi:lysophospholipase L1-like esterase